MATIKYLIKGKNELSTIYVRLRDGRQTDLTVSTGYTINPKFWSETKGVPKLVSENQEKKNLSEDLKHLKRKISDSLNSEKGNGTEINKIWLESVIDKYKNPLLEEKTEYFIDLITNYQKEIKNKINPKTGKQIASTTVRGFTTAISRLTKYEEHLKKRLLLRDIDLNFHHHYTEYVKSNLSLAQNTISKDIKQIKTVCIHARDKGYKINEQILSRKFNAPSEPTLFVTLSELDIQKIKKFKGVNYLENAKDWLIIGCWTGCRVNDLMKLTKDNILVNPKGQKFIRYVQSKTGKQVDLPIHPDVEEIIERLGGFPRPISDQRFNEWIKDVCKSDEVSLKELVHGSRQDPQTHLKETGTFEKWQLIRSHTCRRSFATNHYNKLPNKLIMAVTGHATEQMLLNYIGETENGHIDDFLSVWANDKKVEKNGVELKNKQEN